jgi:hypothetical protein
MIVASVFYGEISSIGNKEKTLAKAFQELGLSNLELLLRINGEKLGYCHHKLDFHITLSSHLILHPLNWRCLPSPITLQA